VVNWNDYLKDTVATPIACDLLSKILIFNPIKRIKTSEILEHKYFTDWHDEADEKDAPYTIEQSFSNNLKSKKRMLWDEMIKVREANIKSSIKHDSEKKKEENKSTNINKTEK